MLGGYRLREDEVLRGQGAGRARLGAGANSAKVTLALQCGGLRVEAPGQHHVGVHRAQRVGVRWATEVVAGVRHAVGVSDWTGSATVEEGSGNDRYFRGPMANLRQRRLRHRAAPGPLRQTRPRPMCRTLQRTLAEPPTPACAKGLTLPVGEVDGGGGGQHGQPDPDRTLLVGKPALDQGSASLQQRRPARPGVGGPVVGLPVLHVHQATPGRGHPRAAVPRCGSTRSARVSGRRTPTWRPRCSTGAAAGVQGRFDRQTRMLAYLHRLIDTEGIPMLYEVMIKQVPAQHVAISPAHHRSHHRRRRRARLRGAVGSAGPAQGSPARRSS